MKLDNAEVECIKLIGDTNQKVEEKDYALINLKSQIRKADKKLHDVNHEMEECVALAKEYLRKNNRSVLLIILFRLHPLYYVKRIYLKLHMTICLT